MKILIFLGLTSETKVTRQYLSTPQQKVKRWGEWKAGMTHKIWKLIPRPSQFICLSSASSMIAPTNCSSTFTLARSFLQSGSWTTKNTRMGSPLSGMPSSSALGGNSHGGNSSVPSPAYFPHVASTAMLAPPKQWLVKLNKQLFNWPKSRHQRVHA